MKIRRIPVALILFLLAGRLDMAEPAFPPDELADALIRIGFQIPREKIPAPDLQLQDLAGNPIRLSSFLGKVVFLNFWATWCPPCREEMPSMERLHRQLGKQGFVLLAVNLQEEREPVQKFKEELGLSFQILLDPEGQSGTRYGIRGIPITYLIDRRGNILGRLIGGRDWQTVEVLNIFGRVLRE